MFDSKKLDLDGTSRLDFIVTDLLDLATEQVGATVSVTEALALAATLEDFGAGYISVEDGACYWYDDTVDAMTDAAQYLEDLEHAGRVLVFHLVNVGATFSTWYEGQAYLLTRTK